jgi:hypothetical protein
MALEPTAHFVSIIVAAARRASAVSLMVLGSFPWAAARADGEPINFNRDIRPILSANCFSCHGPDAANREADLRLDVESEAHRDRDGGIAFKPHDPAASAAWDRILAEDESLRMPPPETNRTLSDEQKQLLKRWIEAGARYAGHWSFEPIRVPDVPAVPASARAVNPIDAFILARLPSQGLEPAPEADRATLLRRVTLDLTGLPPTPEELDSFLASRDERAYEQVVDRLLATPQYAERMAMAWLDAARYADSSGLHADGDREMWGWRDWVIHAFEVNMPFDRFTIDQLAGDLLPDATPLQRLASGFNRNHVTSDEFGAIDEELRFQYVVDRVQTTAAIWLGLTLECAQCHDHKYDPLTQEDYYRFFAFFNRTTDPGMQSRVKNSGATATAPSPLDGSTVNVMVMEDAATPRKTYVHERGVYSAPQLDRMVEPGVPGALPDMAEAAPANRLGLARWLVDDRNPLMARVIVNRFWQLLFGEGLVSTVGDFGSQGAWPSHLELLDWLAADFRGHGWDVKRTIKQMVTSATYRQASGMPSAVAAIDPRNRWLARGPRFRLDAEFVRDQALAVSGLLVRRIGGPSVRPYQPEGLWEEVALSDVTFKQDHGHHLFRRSLYTFWKRTALVPNMQAFDAPSRERCTLARQRTNTPLQALVTLNDPQFVEAARAFAERILGLSAATDEDRIRSAYRLSTAHWPDRADVDSLAGVLGYSRDIFRSDRSRAGGLLSVGESPRNGALDPAEHAAWTVVASMLLNLDKTLTRE